MLKNIVRVAIKNMERSYSNKAITKVGERK